MKKAPKAAIAEVKPVIAADSFSAWRCARRGVGRRHQPVHFLAHDVRDHLEGRRVADAGREEQHQEHREEAPERARLILDAEEVEDARARRPSSGTNTHKVTRPPPHLSATQPVAERDSAPTSGPRKTNCSASTSGNWVLASSGKPAE